MKRFSAFGKSGTMEIDLRKELNEFMFGSAQELPKGQFYILRRMRRKEGIEYPVSKDDIVICDACLEANFEGEANIDFACEKCYGEGFLFDEEIIIGYKTNRFEYQDVEKQQLWGKDTYAVSFFYVEYHEAISRFDKLVEPAIDAEGNIVTPVRENLKHNIHMAERFRADAGRTEFWRLACTSE